MRWLERGAVVIVSVAAAIGIIVLLSGGLAGSRDDPGVSDSGGPPPGMAYPDQGHAVLAPGRPRPLYASIPPTSGPHRPAEITRNDAVVSDDQLLTALQRGDVVLMYSGTRPPRGLQAVADSAAGGGDAFTPALARAGQAVIIARRAGLREITAAAWTHLLRSDDATKLRAFARYWLGRGAASRAGSVAGTG